MSNAMATSDKQVCSLSKLLLVTVLLLLVLSQGRAAVNLSRGEALLTIDNALAEEVTVGVKLDICYKCLVTPLKSTESNATIIPSKHNQSFIVKTAHSACLYVNSSIKQSKSYCPIKYRRFTEHAQYLMTVSDGKCIWMLVGNGQNQYLPILYAAIAIIGLSILWVCLTYGYKLIVNKGLLKYCHVRAVDRAAARDLGVPNPNNPSSNYGSTDNNEQKPLIKPNGSLNSSLISNGTREGGAADGSDAQPKKTRLMSLDAFRGFSLAIMIFVNYGGGGYWFFAHSAWNGLTVADLVFPWFVWIMGVSLVFSFSGRKKDPAWKRLYQIVRRTVILFGLGLFLNSDKDNFKLDEWRIPGVLQRFAVSYCVAALAEFVAVEIYALQKRKIKCTCWEPISDLTNNWIQWLLILTLEFISLLITFVLSNDDCPRGYLGPGGISEWGAYENCTGGAAGIVDRWFFGDSHIYQSPTSKNLYYSQAYDPEGVLGSLNSIVICLLGVQAGRILLCFKGRHIGIIVRFLIWGVLLGVIAALLCEGQADEGIIPINKNLWSLSFILAMAGSGYVLLALFYVLIDVFKLWNGAPFKYPGMNSILVYVGHEILQNFFPFRWPNQEDSHLLFLSANLVGTGLWMLIAYYCYYVDFFVKI